MIKVLFICHGNICRSPMAEFMFKDMTARRGMAERFEIASAATSREEIGNDIHRGTKGILEREGIPYCRRRARQVTKADYDNFDYLIIMDEENRRGLGRIIPADPENKIHKMMEYAGEDRDVADPWYTGNFDETFKDVDKGCRGLLEYLRREGRI